MGASEPHWRLVAILKVVESLRSHDSAAEWYRSRGLPLPSNCMVFGNPPLPLEKTDRYVNDLRRWDALYRVRARSWGCFHVCTAEFQELHNPPLVSQKKMKEIFGYIPGTQTPPSITRVAFEGLLRVALG